MTKNTNKNTKNAKSVKEGAMKNTNKNTKNAKKTREELVRARRERAQKGLSEGLYTIRRVSSSHTSALQWEVCNGNGKGDYTVVYDKQEKRFTCDCPDFEKRGQVIGTCKHIEMVRLWERRRRSQSNGAAAPTGENGHEADGRSSRPTVGIEEIVRLLEEHNRLLEKQNEILRQIDIALAKGLGIA